jgi:hypothetical protein
MIGNCVSEILYAGESFILRLGQQPRIFDLCRWPFAAQDIRDFSCGMGLAVDVGFVGVFGSVAGDDDDGQRESLDPIVLAPS